MAEKKWYDEDQELPSPWEWVIVIVFSLCIAGYGALMYTLISDRPRQWDFGQLPDTPAEGIFSTEVPAKGGQPRRQLPKLPESLPERQRPPAEVQVDKGGGR